MAKLQKHETAESAHAKSPAIVDAKVDEIATGQAQLIESARQEYDLSVKSSITAVQHAATCGGILLRLKTDLPKGTSFVKFVNDNFTFGWRRAYDYVEVYEAVQRSAVSLEQCKSVREALALLKGGNEKEVKKKEDKKEETWVMHAMKIEQWFKAQEEESPVKDWSKARLEGAKRMLQSVSDVYESISSELGRRETKKKGAAVEAEVF